jgi:RimJ/RimL family protein N-acetyltransferase
MRADLQNSGQGGAGAAHTFGWIFETLGVELIGLTAAIDNVRSAKLIEAAGFTAMGEREVARPDGSVRRSNYWEMTREAWRQRHRL